VLRLSAMHTAADVEKILKDEKKLAGLHLAMSVAVDVPNSPAMQLCSHCLARGHGSPEHCPKVHGAEFSIQAVFNDPVWEIGRKKIESLHANWGPVHSIFTGSKIGAKRPVKTVHLTYAKEEDMKAAVPHFLKAFQGQLKSARPLSGYARINCCDECGALGHHQRVCDQDANRSIIQGAKWGPKGQAQPLSGQRRGRPARKLDWNCFQFRDNGTCSYGSNCKFLHVYVKAGDKKAQRADQQPESLVENGPVDPVRIPSPQLSPGSRPNGKDAKDKRVRAMEMEIKEEKFDRHSDLEDDSLNSFSVLGQMDEVKLVGRSSAPDQGKSHPSTHKDKEQKEREPKALRKSNKGSTSVAGDRARRNPRPSTRPS